MNQINAPDGTPLVYDAYEPARPAVAVLFLNDWHPQPTGAADRFSAMGTQLQAAGFAAYCLDQRGHGRSGGRRGHLSRFSQLLGDLQALRRAVRRRQDIPQVLAGHGFGALVVLPAMASARSSCSAISRRNRASRRPRPSSKTPGWPRARGRLSGNDWLRSWRTSGRLCRRDAAPNS